MILTAIRLRNFRQYRGLAELRFANDQQRNVTTITGANGSGKTSLFLAINWCLYAAGTEGRGALLSHGLSDEERREGGFVEVHFVHEGMRYAARRMITGVGKQGEETGGLFLTELGAQGQSKEITNPKQQMNVILPADARQYFFFDAERIDEMSRPGHEEQVRDALHSVLKLTVLERAITHLGDAEREFAKAVRKTDALDEESKNVIEARERIRSEVEQVRRTRDEKQSELEATVRQLDDVIGHLRSLESVSGLLTEEAGKDTELAAAEVRLEQLTSMIAESVARSGPAVAHEAVRIAQKILDEKRQRGEIPSNIREQLIDDLLREGTCICGRPLDGQGRLALERRKQSAIAGEIEETVLIAASQMGGLMDLATSIPAELSIALREYTVLRSEMTEILRAKEALSDKIDQELRGKSTAGFGEDVKGLEATRRQLESRVGDFRFELGKLEKEIEQLEKDDSTRREQLERMTAQSQAARREKRRYELASQARDAAEKLLQTFKEDMRSQIEEATDRIFKSLIWKQDHFEAVKLLKDYRLDVIDRYGSSALPELSAGERQVLSLAFIVAMSRVTGEEAPLVVDTPFGRISEDPLHNIAGSLPNLAGQLVLLVTDKELDPHAKKQLRDSIGREYALDFDDQTGTTQIVGVTSDV